MSLATGQIIEGKYRILSVLGVGGMGSVYAGENTRIHRKVAIKVLHGNVAQKADIVQRFEREAQAAGRIGSEHIVEVLDLGNLPSGDRFMVMEYLDGDPLTDRIKVRGRLPVQEVALLLRQLLTGLGAAHDAGIIHRDLKPDNVYVIKKAGVDFVKILDFGVSKFSGTDQEFSMTRTGAVMGTPYYMSPEQARGQPIDARSDLYSVGVVAYQAATGRVPFNAETFNELIFKIALETPEPIETVVPHFDPAFGAIIRKAMARDPNHRFQSAREFIQAIDHFLGGTPVMFADPTTGGAFVMSQQAAMAHASSGQAGFLPQGRGSSPGMPFGQSGGGYGHQGQAGYQPSAQQQSGGGLGQSGGGLGQSGGGLGQSGGGLGQSGGAMPMGQSQVALSVTNRETKRTPLFAAIGVMLVLGVVGGVFAYRSMGASSAGRPAEPTVAAGDTAAGDKGETAAPGDATAEASPSAEANGSPTAEASATADASASADASAAPEATAEVPTRPGQPYRPPVKPTATAVAIPTATSKPSSGSGRTIGSEL